MPAQSKYRVATGQRRGAIGIDEASVSGQGCVIVQRLGTAHYAAMRLIALLLVLLPVLLVRSGVAFADDPAIVEAVWAEPAEFPPDTAIYTIAQPVASGGFGWAVHRVSRISYGPMRIDEVFSVVGRDGVQFSGFAASTDGSRMVASVLTWTPGRFQDSPPDFGESVFYWSDDGGMRWGEIARLTNTDFFGEDFQFRAVGILPAGPVYRDLSRVEGGNYREVDVNYRYVSDGRLLAGEEVRLLYIPTTNGLGNDRLPTEVVSLPPGRQVALPYPFQSVELFEEAGRPTLVAWYPSYDPSRPYSSYLTVVPDGGRLVHIALEGVGKPTWFSDHTVLATVSWRRRLGEGTLARPLPAFVDIRTGILHPIVDPFDASPFASNSIVALLRGPFLRVATPECLPLRVLPDAFASVTACAAPGVLLRPIASGVRYEKGIEWREASMPNGTTGWVPRNSVER
jgi:hypothetical protein